MQHFWADSEYLGKINTKNFFFQCLALPKDPQSFGSQNLRCPFWVPSRRLWNGAAVTSLRSFLFCDDFRYNKGCLQVFYVLTKKKNKSLFEMPTKNDFIFLADSCKNDIIFGGHISNKFWLLLFRYGFSNWSKYTL